MTEPNEPTPSFIPRWVLVVLGSVLTVAGGIATYDGVSNQFGFSKLPEIFRATIAFIPWWGWLALVQAIVLGALLNYVRSISVRVDQLEARPVEPSRLDNSSAPAERLKAARRTLVADTRAYVARFTQTPRGRDFRDNFESTTIYPEIRPHLSPEFKQTFNNRRLSMSSSGGPMDPFAKLLLDELDRLEQEWKLNEP